MIAAILVSTLLQPNAIPVECGDAAAIVAVLEREAMAPIWIGHGGSTRVTIYSGDLTRDAWWVAVVERREAPGIACVVADGDNFEFGGTQQ